MGRERMGQWEETPLSLPALLQLLKFCLQGLGPAGERWGPLLCPSLQVAAALEESGNTCHQHASGAHGHREARATCQGLLPHLTFLCQAHGLSIEGTEGEDTRQISVEHCCQEQGGQAHLSCFRPLRRCRAGCGSRAEESEDDRSNS